MSESNVLALLIQGGAVGIAILLVWVVYKLVTNHDNHLLNSLDRNTDAWLKNTEVLSKLSEKIDNLKH